MKAPKWTLVLFLFKYSAKMKKTNNNQGTINEIDDAH